MDVAHRNGQPMSLWVVNPKVMKCSKRYISGTNHGSIELFFKLCNMRTHIDGFIDEELAGTTLYNKKVYRIGQVPMDDSIILASCTNASWSLEVAVCDTPIIINPEINNSSVYIYGAGATGQKVLEYLRKEGIEVEGFIDSDRTKTNRSILNKRVYKSEILKSLDRGTSIIEAGKYYQEIDAIVCEQNQQVSRYFCENVNDVFGKAIWIDKNIFFDGVIFIDGSFCKKQLFLCGQDYDLVYKYLEVFHLMSIENGHVARWAGSALNQGEYSIEDALREEDCLLVFCELINRDDLKQLHDLGLEIGKNFCNIRCNIWEKYQGYQMLDTALAFTRDMFGDYPGLTVFGSNQSENYKIAVLGGSTSTSGYYRFKSWPEILHEKYCDDGVNVINGAIESYTSTQELIKLMRDIVGLKPDLVVVYDGNNDVARDESYNIFEIPYMKTIMEHAKAKMRMERNETREPELFCGVSFSENAIDTWLKNIEYMHAVCMINNIRFLSFMQPMLFTKDKAASVQESIMRKKWGFRLSRWGEDKIINQMKEFRRRASDICRTHDYIYDLSHIFDNKDVYMDYCHVYENGNEIIADEIYKIIKDVVKNRSSGAV